MTPATFEAKGQCPTKQGKTEMTFNGYLAGKTINCIGSDGVEYITGCKANGSVWVERADKSPIVILGAKYPCGYVLGCGRGVAFNMFNEATEYAVAA